MQITTRESILDRAIRIKEIRENLSAYLSKEEITGITLGVVDSVSQLAAYLEAMIEERERQLQRR
jgi:hypothetical protein